MDWLGASLIAASIFYTGRNNRWGWVLGGLGGLCFSWIAIEKEVFGLLAFEVLNLTLCAINFVKWSKKNIN